MPIHDWTRVDAGIFHGFHLSWISHIKERLNTGGLPPDFYADAEQYADGKNADVLALHRSPAGSSTPITTTAPVTPLPPSADTLHRTARKSKTEKQKQRRLVVRHIS